MKCPRSRSHLIEKYLDPLVCAHCHHAELPLQLSESFPSRITTERLISIGQGDIQFRGRNLRNAEVYIVRVLPTKSLVVKIKPGAGYCRFNKEVDDLCKYTEALVYHVDKSALPQVGQTRRESGQACPIAGGPDVSELKFGSLITRKRVPQDIERELFFDINFTCMTESVNAVEAWLGSLPGHVYANVRQPPVSTLNLVHMIPLSAVWAGPVRDEHLGAPALFSARTEGATPFRFSLHVGDVGHTLVVGPTGAGKSVLLALMALQFRRYPNAQVFAFDFGGSIRAAALAMGGDWHDLGGALSDDATEPVALQPLGRIDDAAERAWAAEWITNILARETIVVTPEAKDHLWSALTSLASAPPAERTLTGLSVLLQSQMLKRALQPYCLGGPYGRLLDAEAERLGEADVQAFETEGLIGTSAAPAVLAYLFHRIEGRLDGRPTLLIVDEGWLALDDEGFAGQLREWLKTLRKKNASVIFATQSLSDIDGSAIAPAIIESCPTRLFLPNERAIEPQITAIYRRFGLNDRQIEILARATPKRDYYCQSRCGNRLFELGLGRVALAFTAASSKSDQADIKQILAEHGREGFVAAWLRHRGLAWAADIIPDLPAEGNKS
jgi:type IV secretion/conjugal transfer VirB4 family ATPase